MASPGLRKELECSICLNVYTDPVTLRCGHNFCRVCIDHVLNTQDGSGVYSCPECRAEFQERPVLIKNITLRNVVENFLFTHPHQEEITGIVCTSCIHSPVPAVKSCLHCEASLCNDHLRVHSKGPEHVLSDPSTNLEKRKCSVHKKILEYYCTEDAACICVSCCLVGEHRGHEMESLDKASEKKKRQLRNVLENLITKRKEAVERVQSLEECRRKAQDKASGEAERVTALFIDIRRRLDDLEKRVLSEISRQEEQRSLSLSDVIQKLEIKKAKLSRTIRNIEELCNMTDPLTVLQDPYTIDLCDPEEGGGDEDTGGHNGGDKDAGAHDRSQEGKGGHNRGHKEAGGHDRSHEDTRGNDGGDQGVELISLLSHTLSDIIRGVHVTFYVQDPTDILLDVKSAAEDIFISDDLKTATYGVKNRNLPKKAERFEYNQVISSSKISSGRHYWDVETSGSVDWIVGVCYPSIARRGRESHIGESDKSWGLYVDGYNNRISVRHDGTEIWLPHPISIYKIRIYVDYKAGQLSFYELCDPIRHLYSFIPNFSATFDEPLLTGFAICGGYIKILGGSSCEK